MERIFKYETKEVGQIRVVIGNQEIREYTVVSETVYEAVGKNMPLNHLVHSVHIAQVKEENELFIYYKDCYGHNIAVMNDSIINLLTMEENLCLMPNGVIVLWSEHSICSTVDMQHLDFHTELNDFLKEFSIIHISEKYITLQNRNSGELEARKIHIEIDCSGKCPVKIQISKKKETC